MPTLPLSQAAHLAGTLGGVNGSGGTNRIDIGRNTFSQPITWITDLRVSKSFSITERYKMEILTDFFNLANKQNVTGVNTTAYIAQSTGTIPLASGGVATCTAANPCLGFNVASPTSATPFAPLFGSATNSNSNFIYNPRQIQLELASTSDPLLRKLTMARQLRLPRFLHPLYAG